MIRSIMLINMLYELCRQIKQISGLLYPIFINKFRSSDFNKQNQYYNE